MSIPPGSGSPIDPWSAVPPEALAALDPDGDFAKKHLINPVVFRLVGDLTGRTVLDAGAGQGYLSRLLAGRGARVTAVEPATGPYRHGVAREAELHQGITWVQADLTTYRSDPVFDIVVSSMVFLSIPDWTAALHACVGALRPGGLLVFSIDHPCFEPGATAWTDSGVVPLREYLAEYTMDRPVAPDTHRPLATYLNAVIAAGCHLTEIVEPGLDPAIAADGPPGAALLAHIPNFLIVAATKTPADSVLDPHAVAAGGLAYDHPHREDAFVRFESARANSTGRHVGIFGLVNVLGRHGMLSSEEETLRQTANAWFDAAYPDPAAVDPRVYDVEANPSSTAWFKATATELLEHVPLYLRVLDAHGVAWRRQSSSRPGRVIYEDPFQVVVVDREVDAGGHPARSVVRTDDPTPAR